jgi:hypothetical protein
MRDWMHDWDQLQFAMKVILTRQKRLRVSIDRMAE